jgi:hypothetical protein
MEIALVIQRAELCTDNESKYCHPERVMKAGKHNITLFVCLEFIIDLRKLSTL